MNVHVSSNEPITRTELPVIECSCGAKILIVPNIKYMSTAIEAHVKEHKKKIKDPKKAEAEVEQIRDDLIGKVLDKTSETQYFFLE